MSYLEELQTQLNNRNFDKFVQLWEEYCTNDVVDVEELKKILMAVKASDLAKSFGQIAETALPLWRMIEDQQSAYDVLSLLIDLQTTNSPQLHKLALEMLTKQYGHEPQFNERLRQVHMRGDSNFQGALSNYRLLAHMALGKFVYHAGGWGTGEIVDISSLREQVTIEFENLSGRKHLTFANAFNGLVPLSDEHFLARRFADGDALEKECREDPIAVLKILLRDLGPQSAADIKDQLCDIVIPEDEWTRWWQMARSKLKKDTMIELPGSLKECFKLRSAVLKHEDRLLDAFKQVCDADGIILTAYNFVRDFPILLKNNDVKHALHDKFKALLADPSLSPTQQLQVYIFLEHQLGVKLPGQGCEELILSNPEIEKVIDAIEILAFKKRALVLVRNIHGQWAPIFLELLMADQQSTLREFLLNELHQGAPKVLREALDKLLQAPGSNPEMFIWYFQLLLSKELQENLPFASKEGLNLWLEGFLILLHIIEFKPEYRLMAKKMHALLTGKRYAVIRRILEGSSLEFVKEFLLLASKCHSFSDADIKTLRSLAAVVHPSVAKVPGKDDDEGLDGQTLWTTEASYRRMQERIVQIGTTEIVANAREIEAARALGDLRENSEYKFALEKRSRLQGELKKLSEQMHSARIITPADIDPNQAAVGSVVALRDSQGNEMAYSILGPWDADPESNILSAQSKLGQALIGCVPGENLKFRDEEYYVVGLKSIFDAQ